ncbi:MAG: nuclear transport factor 2 family protein, partial [Acidobacteria bacterium]|nr:nuclear transport factor 2 family protein [Acidobacteriota bacterium]
LGRVYGTKSDAVNAWTAQKCEIGSVTHTDGKAYALGANAALLTLHGTATGTCDGQPIRPVRHTTVYTKEGSTWKAAYIIQSPA